MKRIGDFKHRDFDALNSTNEVKDSQSVMFKDSDIFCTYYPLFVADQYCVTARPISNRLNPHKKTAGTHHK